MKRSELHEVIGCLFVSGEEVLAQKLAALAKGKKKKKWIQDAIKKPGALHKQLGVPEDKKIPKGKLDKAAKKGGKLGKRARLAETLRGLPKKG